METAQKWSKWFTHIEHRTGVAETCPICDDPVTEIALKSPALSGMVYVSLKDPALTLVFVR